MTALLPRLTAGRFPGDNAEVLKALGIEHLVSELIPPTPLDSVDDALRLVPEGWLVDCYQWRGIANPWEWTLKDDRVNDGPCVNARASTCAHALTLAILWAKEVDDAG